MENINNEFFGTLTKQEPLSCIESELLIQDSCVLEAISPFYGYYENITTGSKPLYLYLMLENNHSFKQIQSAIFAAKMKASFNFDAVKGNIQIADSTLHDCIRIRNLERYDQIASLQQLLKDEGLKLKKKTRAFEKTPALIQLDKLFYVQDWGNEMFLDLQVAHHGYFGIKQNLSWTEFVALTKEVKYDTNLLFFDAALACFYHGSGISFFVRIYKENMDRMQLAAIRNRYVQLLG